ncbi:MAG: DUF808 domain-containing protein [Beijerinckiaceae bacterium]|nr:DUF808 domain-containing protein [Beijerinckiaceae bacterium]
MSIGLIALLDDIAALAKVAAASLDDVAAQALQAGGKAAGVVIDDAAVTPRYVTGFTPARELPIIARITLGSLKNKLLILLPAALALSLFAPFLITPLLMIGGVYLCFEGAEKIWEKLVPHAPHSDEAPAAQPQTAAAFEAEKIASAVKTDFILSAEIMAITLGAVPDSSILTQAVVLAVVGLGITLAVYGVVALIVKADDVGLWLARLKSQSFVGKALRALGRGLVKGMPIFLTILGMIGTAAMIWVGGGIIIHGFEHYGLAGPAHLLAAAGLAAAGLAPAAGPFLDWLAQAAGSGVLGLAVGFLAIMGHAAYVKMSASR